MVTSVFVVDVRKAIKEELGITSDVKNVGMMKVSRPILFFMI